MDLRVCLFNRIVIKDSQYKKKILKQMHIYRKKNSEIYVRSKGIVKNMGSTAPIDDRKQVWTEKETGTYLAKKILHLLFLGDFLTVSELCRAVFKTSIRRIYGLTDD